MNDQSSRPGPSISELNVYPCFMPESDCVANIVEWIRNARESIIVEAYSFSSVKIAEALLNAKSAGVNVKIMIDKCADKKKHSMIPKLRDNGIEIQVDQHSKCAHNKVMIMDNKRVITGSYNWTDERYYHDSDVVLFISDECVAEKYKNNHEFLESNRLFYIRNSQARKLRCGSCFFTISNGAISYQDEEGFIEYTSRSKAKKEKSKNFVDIDVCFPRFDNQDCIDWITTYIGTAKISIFIQACSFTHRSIFVALISARKRNIDIKILVDCKAFYDKKEVLRDLIDADIEIRCDTTCHPGIAHSKTIIVDNDLVFSGSLNLTNNAQNHNRENVLRMNNIYVNSMFKEHFYSKWNASKRMEVSNCPLS